MISLKTQLERTQQLWPHIVAVLALGALALVSSLLWLEVQKRFPHIEPGSYFGSMRGVLGANNSKSVSFYVERTPGQDDLFFMLLEPGWQPQLVSGVVKGAGGAEKEWLLPISVSGPDTKLKLVGGKIESGLFRRAVTDINNRQEGLWELRAIRPDETLSTNSNIDDLRLWLMLRAELGDVEAQIYNVQNQIPRQKEEIEKLTNFVTEGEQLRASSDEQLKKVKAELKDLQQKLSVRQQVVSNLEAKVNLAHKVTPRGRLVLLARESLDREGRWIDSVTLGMPALESDSFVEQYAQSQRIFELKHAIAVEKDRIFRLEEESRNQNDFTAPVKVAPGRFDSAWDNVPAEVNGGRP